MESLINLSNFAPHPGDNRYLVFRFSESHMATEFENRLAAASIPFERHEETIRGTDWILYGVSRDFEKAATRANYLTAAAHRKKFIPNKAFRWGVVALGLAIVLLAIVSTLMQSQ